MKRMIFIGADHAGFDVKEKIKKYLKSKKIFYEDFSPVRREGDDYPLYAFEVAKRVVETKDSKGILVCGSDTGMVIAANKVKGARAVAPYDEYTAKMSRRDDDANIIAFRGRHPFYMNKIKRLLDIWLNTKFSGAMRHKRRIKEISKYEKKK